MSTPESSESAVPEEEASIPLSGFERFALWREAGRQDPTILAGFVDRYVNSCCEESQQYIRAMLVRWLSTLEEIKTSEELDGHLLELTKKTVRLEMVMRVKMPFTPQQEKAATNMPNLRRVGAGILHNLKAFLQSLLFRSKNRPRTED